MRWNAVEGGVSLPWTCVGSFRVLGIAILVEVLVICSESFLFELLSRKRRSEKKKIGLNSSLSCIKGIPVIGRSLESISTSQEDSKGKHRSNSIMFVK